MNKDILKLFILAFIFSRMSSIIRKISILKTQSGSLKQKRKNIP